MIFLQYDWCMNTQKSRLITLPTPFGQIILSTENKGKNVTTYGFKHVIIPEKGWVCTVNNLDMMISAYNYYWFWTNMKTFLLKLLNDEKTNQENGINQGNESQHQT